MPPEAPRQRAPEATPAADAAACTHHGEVVEVLRQTRAGHQYALLRTELALYDMDPAFRAAPDDLLGALLRARPDLARDHRDRVLGPVLDLRPAWHGRELLDTLYEWIAADCDANRTAKAMYCHLNTVKNRLDAVGRLAGLSLKTRYSVDPMGLVDLVLALEAHRILQSPPNDEGARR